MAIKKPTADLPSAVELAGLVVAVLQVALHVPGERDLGFRGLEREDHRLRDAVEDFVALRVRHEVLPVPDDHLRERQVREGFQALVRPGDEIRPQKVEHVAEMVVVARMRRRGQEDRVLGLLLLTQVLGQVVHLNAGLREVVRLVEDDEIPRVGIQGRFLVPPEPQRVDRRDQLVERLKLVDVVALEPIKVTPKSLGEFDPATDARALPERRPSSGARRRRGGA